METGKIFGIAQLALCAVAYVLAAVLCAVHIIKGNIATLGGYALCLALLLSLRWLTAKSYEQLKSTNDN